MSLTVRWLGRSLSAQEATDRRNHGVRPALASRCRKCLPVAVPVRVEGHACHATQQIVQLDAIAGLEVAVDGFWPNPCHLDRAVTVVRIGERYIPRNLSVDTDGLHFP